MKQWRGVTYPGVLCHKPILALWRRVCCTRGWHLWDEVASFDVHYIFCDACDKLIEVYDAPEAS